MLNANLYRKVDGAFSFTKPFDLPVNLMPLETGQDVFFTYTILNKILSREHTVKLNLKTCIFPFNHMFKIF